MAHHVPKIEHWSIFNSSPIAFINEWLVYLHRLLSKPLDERSTKEVGDARPFLKEVASMTTMCPSEFASTKTVDRKEVASIADDLLRRANQAIGDHDAKASENQTFMRWPNDAAILNLI